ncbi:MAG: S8 family serine peptidase [Clostridia bacterium]|nr:S8 family serine peptidase [Clostridia bacterium]
MKKTRWILALLMAMLMIAVTIMPAFAAEGDEPNVEVVRELTETEDNVVTSSSDGKTISGDLTALESGLADDTVVTAIVIFGDDGAAPLDEELTSTKAADARSAMRGEQNAFVARMQQKFEVELLFNYTVLANGIAIETTYGNLATIEQMEGVQAVYIANEYSVPEVTVEDEVDPDSYWAATITGAMEMYYNGLTGAGTTVAILDTGLTTTHEAFQDYGMTEPVITEETLANVATPGKYLSEKVPYAYDYADKDDDVTDVSGHGTHVAGIAVGYSEDGLAGDGAINYIGSAPGAQLLAMKIFADDSGTTNSSIYFQALEDAMLLGADVINMSIGSDSGFTYDYSLETEVFGNIFQKLEDAGVVVCCSAGNDNTMGQDSYNMTGAYPQASYTDYGVVGAPSTYDGNLSVASSDNWYYPAGYFNLEVPPEVDGEDPTLIYFSYTDSCADGVHGWVDNFENQIIDYVVIKAYDEDNNASYSLGYAEDYEGIDVTGKIAVVKRGDITFQEKVDNAAAAGAIGCIVVNNTDESRISMAIDPFAIPAISVQPDAGDALWALADEDGIGDIQVMPMEYVEYETGGQISSFSSWGVTPNLELKPQITGVGGYVYSASMSGDGQYEIMSGTSMAAPNVTGCMAVLIGMLREQYPELSKVEIADLAEDLALSTTDIVFDAYGYPMPTRAQGAGLIDIAEASAADAVIVDPIINLGDSVTGEFEFTFTVKNLTNARLRYAIQGIYLMPYYNDGTSRYGYTNMYDTLEADYIYMDSYEYYADGYSQPIDAFYVPAEGERTITVKATVDPDYLAYREYIFAQYGIDAFETYFEGFVFLVPLRADLTYYEVHFETGDVVWVPYGDALEDCDIPEVPHIYGQRGYWDYDLTAPIYADVIDPEIKAVYEGILYGDATCGGEVDAADSSAVLRYLVKLGTLTEQGIENAIVTPNYDELKAADAAAILRYVVRLIDEFPIEEYNRQMNEQAAAGRSKVVAIEDFEDTSAWLHATFMGYIGDWTSKPVMEEYDYRYFTAYHNLLKELGYFDLGYRYYNFNYYDSFGFEVNNGITEVYPAIDQGYDEETGALTYGRYYYYYLGDNFFTLEDYAPEKQAISNPNTDADRYYADSVFILPALTRNARNLIMQVIDVETGRVLYEDDTEYARKQVYNTNTSLYNPSTSFGWNGLDYHLDWEPDPTLETPVEEQTAPEPSYVESGTEVYIVFWSVLEGESREDFETQTGDPGRLEFVTSLLVDYEAPTLVSVKYTGEDSDDYEIRVTDNHMLANFWVYYLVEGEEEIEPVYIIDRNGVDELEAERYASGNYYDVVSDLQAVRENSIDGMLYIELIDYATNRITYEVPVKLHDPTIEEIVDRIEVAEIVDEQYLVDGIVNYIVDDKTVYLQSTNDDVDAGGELTGILVSFSRAHGLSLGDLVEVEGTTAVEEYTALPMLKSATVVNVAVDAPVPYSYYVKGLDEITTDMMLTRIDMGYVPEGYVYVTLSGSGYQMLIDETGEAYGVMFDSEEFLTDPDFTDGFTLPITADVEGTIVAGEEPVTVRIPAGTYDFAIFEPVVGENSVDWVIPTSGATADDFTFVEGRHYYFNVDNDVVTNTWINCITESSKLRVVEVDTEKKIYTLTNGVMDENGELVTFLAYNLPQINGRNIVAGDVLTGIFVLTTLDFPYEVEIPAEEEGGDPTYVTEHDVGLYLVASEGEIFFVTEASISDALVPGTYYVSAQSGDFTFYVTDQLVRGKLQASSVKANAAVITVERESSYEGALVYTYKIANEAGEYLVAETDGTNFTFSADPDAATIWSWDGTNKHLYSGTRALAFSTSNNGVFGNYALSNDGSAGYTFALDFELIAAAIPVDPVDPDPDPDPADPYPDMAAGNWVISVEYGPEASPTVYYATSYDRASESGNKNKLNATTSSTDAAVWTATVSGNGFTLSTTISGTTYYLVASSTGTNLNVSTTATPTVWTWDATNKYLKSAEDRAFTFRRFSGDGLAIFGNYSTSQTNMDNAEYEFKLKLIPVV